jgi:peroxiredoxin Q/BCP
MRNNTPSCDAQTFSLAEKGAEIGKLGYSVIAISRDTGGSHVKYAAMHGFAFTLVSDPEDRFAQAADAIVDKKMYGRSFRGPARSAFVLDREGVVLAVIHPLDTKDHGSQVIRTLQTLAAAR